MADVSESPTSKVSNRQPVEETPKPLVLASQALAEDLAPIQPGRQNVRLVFMAIGISLALLGLAVRGGLGPQGGSPDPASIAYALGGACVAVALLPFPYALRAAVGLVLGLVLIVLGARGLGPLGGMAADGVSRDLGRLTAMTALPAALLFRAHYRAYRRARLVLAVALLISLPFAVGEILLALDAAAPSITRLGAVLDMVFVSFGLFGFMGHHTTGAGSVWASLLLLMLPASIAMKELTPLASGAEGTLVYATTAVGTLCAAVLTSVGLYQLLAAALAPDARACIKRPDQAVESIPA